MINDDMNDIPETCPNCGRDYDDFLIFNNGCNYVLECRCGWSEKIEI